MLRGLGEEGLFDTAEKALGAVLKGFTVAVRLPATAAGQLRLALRAFAVSHLSPPRAVQHGAIVVHRLLRLAEGVHVRQLLAAADLV